MMEILEKFLASDQTIEERISTCKSCPSFINLTQVCSVCCCVMPMKVRFKASSCPESKWLDEKVE